MRSAIPEPEVRAAARLAPRVPLAAGAGADGVPAAADPPLHAVLVEADRLWSRLRCALALGPLAAALAWALAALRA